jgi:YfiH family protein
VSDIEVIRVAALAAVPHGFLGRRGGVSTGELAGLNVGFGSQDDRAAIEENRQRAIEAVAPGAALATVHQVHSGDAVYVEAPWPQAERPHADAMVTDRPGILLGILTADCAPVLFADPGASVVGAAHAGWRGAVAGVTDSTIEAMERLGAKREQIVAAVGPCIAQSSYEVDDAFRDRFLEADQANVQFFIPGPQGKPHFDLAGYVAHRLRGACLAQVEVAGLDTYSDANRFYSFRRATHRGEADYGRQVSLIGLGGTSA